MGVYGEYLNQPLARNFQLLTQERKKQLKRISQARGGRDVLVYAADISKAVPGTSIEYADLAPLGDLVANLSGNRLDLILETPGGSGEVAEDIVRLLHGKYDELAVIIPGWAKSAGTLLTMAADEILMGPTSALGPIDAQLIWQGKRFSADALLESFEKIKSEVDSTGTLNKAYIPMLQAYRRASFNRPKMHWILQRGSPESGWSSTSSNRGRRTKPIQRKSAPS
jgi:ClpP class serine protease